MKRFFSVAAALVLSAVITLPAYASALIPDTTEPAATVALSEESSEQSTSGVTAGKFVITVDVNEVYTGNTAEDADDNIEVQRVKSNKHIYIACICALLVFAIVIICVKSRGRDDDADDNNSGSGKNSSAPHADE